VGRCVRGCPVLAGPDGQVLTATLNEGGGGLNPRTNIMEMSANGGASWCSVNMGASFPAPGVALCSSNSYFVNMYPQYWRHMGWGDVAVGPSNVVHHGYAQHGAGADKGDICYVPSTASGL